MWRVEIHKEQGGKTNTQSSGLAYRSEIDASSQLHSSSELCLLIRTHISLLNVCKLQWFPRYFAYIWPEPSCRITRCLSGLLGGPCSQALCDKKAHMAGKLPKPLAPTMGIASISEHPLQMSLNLAIEFIWAVSVRQSGTTWQNDHSCALQFVFITRWSHRYGCPSCLPQWFRTVSRVCLPISWSVLLFLPRENIWKLFLSSLDFPVKSSNFIMGWLYSDWI